MDAYSGAAGAYIDTAGVGQSYGPGNVTQTFGGYRTVNSSCKTYLPIMPAGQTVYLECRLGY
ncbi:hypothetical protein [Leifsonia sp. PS1209]|uniref:hypothetical protein n=1 Tax=Leifsonia sp. PS1209 TaxID=2724914 RepID=UPI001442C342|nr:hypothetical protein [Leifsonia sp. PS1209]QJA00353.1 hypothetical protein HF024_18830 [Leifsonia sp. PS1209]